MKKSKCKQIIDWISGNKKPYENTYPIDDWIDQYWFVNCPGIKSNA